MFARRLVIAVLGTASLFAARSARAGDGHRLRQWVDAEGVTHLEDGSGVVSEVHRWVDAEGATHLTLGPSKEARAKAQRLSLAPLATGQVTRVHETAQWDGAIANAAAKYNIPEELVRAVIIVESNFHPDAISRVGARGLMQLMPNTAEAMYVSDFFDPVQNIYGGTRYLRILANMFGGDLVKTIAAYNAGPDAVRKAGGIPHFAETESYVKRVRKLYRIYRGLE